MTRTHTNQRQEATRTNAALVRGVGSCRLAGVNQRHEPTRTNAALAYGVGWHPTRTNEPTPPLRVALVRWFVCPRWFAVGRGNKSPN